MEAYVASHREETSPFHRSCAVMSTRFALVARQITFNLRGGFLVRPLVLTLMLGTLGALFSQLEETFPAAGGWVPSVIFPSHADPLVGQAILGAIATSIMTVVSIVFAILLMTLTLASMQFSPRIIVSFSRDRITQWTLGLFLGTFLYCIAALPAARSMPRPFMPAATVLGAMVLAICCVGMLLFFIHHISRAISVSHIVDRIASETVAIIDETMPKPRSLPPRPKAQTWDLGPQASVILCTTSGYLRFIDQHRLVRLARAYRIRVQVLRRVGQFIPEGTPLTKVNRADRLTHESKVELSRAFDLGPSRTLQQDLEFGILQIVDIALKAISPAVNDPTTAINCVDQLSRILIRYVAKEPPEAVLYAPPGIGRVAVPWIGFSEILRSAFDQIRHYSKSDLAVSLRLMRAVGDIAMTTKDPEILGELVKLGDRTFRGCEAHLTDEDLTPLRDRMAQIIVFQTS